jgi:hypothetical protein
MIETITDIEKKITKGQSRKTKLSPWSRANSEFGGDGVQSFTSNVYRASLIRNGDWTLAQWPSKSSNKRLCFSLRKVPSRERYIKLILHLGTPRRRLILKRAHLETRTMPLQ